MLPQDPYINLQIAIKMRLQKKNDYLAHPHYIALAQTM
jgi:hypothetical protein